MALTVTTSSGPNADPVGFVLQVLCSGITPFALRWPKAVGIALGVALAACIFTPSMTLGLAALTHNWMVGVAQSMGRRRLAGVLSITYFSLSVIIIAVAASRQNYDGVAVASAIVLMLVLYLLPLAVGELVYRASNSVRVAVAQQQRAAVLERQAIARELHDTIAYASTLMVMRAETAKLRPDLDAKSADDFTYIAETARRSSDDLRSMLALLRKNSALPQASPTARETLASTITTTSQNLRNHGFDVSVRFDCFGEISATNDYILARILTECGANVIKHGDRATTVRLMVERDADKIELLMLNGLTGHTPNCRHIALGLIGIRELAAVANGTVSAEPRGSDTWATHVTIPLKDLSNE